MAKIDCKPEISCFITLRLDEGEAAALDALFGYGAEALLGVYEQLGKCYMAPYRQDLIRLGESIRADTGSVRDFLNRARKARKEFDK